MPDAYSVGCDCSGASQRPPRDGGGFVEEDAGRDAGAPREDAGRDGGSDAGTCFPDAGLLTDGGCPTCSERCLIVCQTGCWASFMTCLDGCTTSNCAPFCQADLGGCYNFCPGSTVVATCRTACP